MGWHGMARYGELYPGSVDLTADTYVNMAGRVLIPAHLLQNCFAARGEASWLAGHCVA